MSRAKVLGIIGACLMVIGLATCELGYRYERSKIPRGRLARMADTDWIGVEWIGLGSLAIIVGLMSGCAAVVAHRKSAAH